MKMFRRLLLFTFICIFHSVCCVQNIQETTTSAYNGTNISALDESTVLTTVMLVTLSSVLIILVPTALYYRFCGQGRSSDTWPTEIH